MRNPLYARDYEALWSPIIRPMAEVVLGQLPIGSARRILDVGTAVWNAEVVYCVAQARPPIA